MFVSVRATMAATLPPINGSAGSRKGQNVQHFMPSPPKGPPSGKKLKPLRKVPGTPDRDIFVKHDILRQQQPDLSKRQTASYRNTYKHNLCLDMLQEGYHKSFSELFALIKQQEEERLERGPESLMWTMTLLKDQHAKLDMLKVHLTKAEEAYRKGDFAEVYRNRYELARYFQSMRDDKWLADHFFTTCLQTSMEVKGDHGKMQAQGHYNVGVSYEENGDNYEAVDHFEAYYKLAVDHKEWITADDVTFHTDACINLWRIYTTIGLILERQEELEKALDFLTKALNMAKECNDKSLEGQASYTLGLSHEKCGDGKSALVHLNNFLDVCNESGDSEGIGKACDAISKAYASQGKLEESIEYLRKFVEVTEQSGEEIAFSKACHNLGNILNSLGRYEEATDYFSKAYNISRTLSDKEAINTNRVQFGIAMAHRMMSGFHGHVVLEHRNALERMIEWKSARTDDFEKPFPEPKEEEPPKPPSPAPPAPVEAETTQDEDATKETEQKDNTMTEDSGTLDS
ncbi:tetratricopeptide repeat protein 29-like [Ylistrum balloti]|uniref:tetratricopeptide repeat protein 29-like n=1 Tax=Ylistrum balloti TaxID=509963 RepID=UPI002905A766|nr:tetratricopeptide repeat protein 29-like [Ylistrum balloti]